MRSTDIPEIRSLPLFQNIADDNFDKLTRGAYVQTFPPRIELITEGDPSDFLHIVVEGSVELLANWNGRETTMSTVRPMATFILAATIRDAPYLMSARTIEKSRIVLLPSTDVREAFDADGGFSRSIVSELAQRYRAAIKTTKDLKLRTATERLANYLLRQRKLADGAASFDLLMEKRRLASYLGMTPENLSRAIRALQPYGVAITGQHVEIGELAKLQAFAVPAPLIDDPES